ncbi:hypothetical protein Moror_5028 [Moniliophthora roreri MCA 2997]|nr:hypothetical protein Moror_5028 [Moniliophthora roreri MCA 2997]KAI3614013.1 hypothetical protein WG66_010762 [Moniliophthora roreri]
MQSNATTLLEALSTDEASAIRRLSTSAFDPQVISLHLFYAEKDLEICEKEILQLVKKRDLLARRVERCRSLLAPINKIPSELLSSIFELCCEENTLRPDVTSPAIILSAVSHRWREIALTAPRLWSSLKIEFVRFHGFKSLQKLAHTARLFMDRSRSSPLKLNLDWSVGFQDDHLPVLETIIKQSARWVHFDVNSYDETLLKNRIFQPLRGRLPLLKYLNLGTDECIIESYVLFSDTPALRSLSYTPNSSSTVTEFPFEHLAHLKLRRCYSDEAIMMLERCIRLEKLELDWLGDNIVEENIPQLHMSAVKSLIFRALEQEPTTFAHFVLPQLSSIEISCPYPGEYCDNWEQWNITQLFLQQSSSFITYCRLETILASDIQVMEFLNCMPMLQTLCIEDMGRWDNGLGHIRNRTVTSTFLQRLLVKVNSSVFLPRLEDLMLRARMDDFNASACSIAVLSRFRPDNGQASAVCLRSIEIELKGNGSLPRELASLDHFNGKGIRVKVFISEGS